MNSEILVIALGGRVVGLDANTGGEMWRNEMELGGISFVALAADETHVFASASARKVFCIDRQTGKTLWAQSTSGMGRATLLLSKEKLIVSKGGRIDCFTTAGKALWNHDLRKTGKGVAALCLANQVVQADG